MKKKFIVITTIAAPTEAIKKFARLEDWQIIVVGDKKTPRSWKYKNIIYLSPQRQQGMDFEITKLLPWNHYSRKMIGYLYAIKDRAEIIYDTDDDNFPLSHWFEPSFYGKMQNINGSNFFNTYSEFTSRKIWPRGFPLSLINTKTAKKVSTLETKVGIWQFLANGDTDVDAVYRLTDNRTILFKNKKSFALNRGTVSLINSQNTFFAKEMFSLLYLPAFVTFRFTDILRGLVAQPLMWKAGYRAAFGGATVFQQRNKHDYMKDFESELPMYLNVKKVVQYAEETLGKPQSLEKNLFEVYKILSKHGIVQKRELLLLKAWIKDIKSLSI